MLSLSSRRAGRGARRIEAAAEAARAAGFASVHASLPPSDSEGGRAVLDAFGLTLCGVSTDPVEEEGGLADALARAAAAARALREPRIVVDLRPYAAPSAPSREAAVDAVARSLFGSYATFGGVALAIRAGAGAGTLFGLVECEWLLDALSGKGLSIWLDPWRASRVAATAGASAKESRPPPTPLDWADRLAKRAAGVFVEGAGARGEGHGLPEEGGIDWGTLRGLLPARAVRVLDVGPEPLGADVVETRRRFEEVLGY